MSLQCEDLHKKAKHLTMLTCHSEVSKIVGQLRLKILTLVCEESEVSLEHLPHSFLKTGKGRMFETSPDMLEVM